VGRAGFCAPFLLPLVVAVFGLNQGHAGTGKGAGSRQAAMDRLTPERMFLKVVESGSFAAAAARLGASSGQASKLVARLEARLGVKLLNRTTRALALTEAGQAYAGRLRGLIEAQDDLETEARNAAITLRGRIRLTAPLSFGTLRLAPLLADFAAAYPEISLEVQFSDRLANLVDEGFDAAIRVGNPADSSLTGRKLGQVRMLVVAAPAYLERLGDLTDPSDLTRRECIIDTNFRDPHRWTFGEGPGVPVAGRVVFSDASACLAAAETGLGIACVPEFVATDSLASGRVVRLLRHHRPEVVAIHALYPSGRNLPAKVRVLTDFLVEALRHGP